MIDAPALTRYCAYAAVDGGGPAHEVEAENFAEAAVLFAETWGADGELRVIVTDQATGETHCYCVDIGAGETAPCD